MQGEIRREDSRRSCNFRLALVEAKFRVGRAFLRKSLKEERFSKNYIASERTRARTYTHTHTEAFAHPRRVRVNGRIK